MSTRILTAQESKSDILSITNLLQSVIKQGKIKVDNSDSMDVYPSKEDKQRTSEVLCLMDKYHYGWYIATELYEKQIESLFNFAKYINNHIGLDVIFEDHSFDRL